MILRSREIGERWSLLGPCLNYHSDYKVSKSRCLQVGFLLLTICRETRARRMPSKCLSKVPSQSPQSHYPPPPQMSPVASLLVLSPTCIAARCQKKANEIKASLRMQENSSVQWLRTWVPEQDHMDAIRALLVIPVQHGQVTGHP